MYGTYTLDDLKKMVSTTVESYGEAALASTVQSLNQQHNALVEDMMGTLVERTTEKGGGYGGSAVGEFQEMDEFASPDAVKVAMGSNVGYPLAFYGIALQWTRLFLLNASVATIATTVSSVQANDLRNIQRQIMRALFTPTNRTVRDKRVNPNMMINVKALVNADGEPIPTANTQTFDGGTHTHYLYTAGTTLAAADADALLETVTEHYKSGAARIHINRAQEVAVRALDDFIPYVERGVVLPSDATYSTLRTLNTMQTFNRAIGTYKGAEVWVKPWIPAGYLHAYVEGAETPLRMRVRNDQMGSLQLIFEQEEYPLRARSYGREFGIGVHERTNGAVLYIDTGNVDAYVAPSY